MAELHTPIQYGSIAEIDDDWILEQIAEDGYTVAVDFDGTLCVSEWPKIGRPHQAIIDKLIQLQRCGINTILWTCREGDSLQEAVDWCERHGLRFTSVNANTPLKLATFQVDSRKVGAEEYWDDKCFLLRDGRFWDDDTPPRVMTQEEIASVRREDWLWIERRILPERDPDLYHLRVDAVSGEPWFGDPMYKIIYFDTPFSSMTKHTYTYGESWRAWTAMPSDLIRASTPWKAPEKEGVTDAGG